MKKFIYFLGFLWCLPVSILWWICGFILLLIGGIEKFVSPGQKVLLKPNLLGTFEPDKAVTTHPELVKAIAVTARIEPTPAFIWKDRMRHKGINAGRTRFLQDFS